MKTLHAWNRPVRFLLLTMALALAGCAGPRAARFQSPDEAATALVSALRAGDRRELRRILGDDSDKLLSSGDKVADRNTAVAFVRLYDERHAWTDDAGGGQTLLVGTNEWPLPIPVVQDKGNTWSFDTAAGIEEVLNRRVGRNELATIQVCLAIVDAQREYAVRDPERTGVPMYATRIISEPGRRNGLYWPASPGEPESPLGPLVAEAAAEGYGARTSEGAPAAYHGYHYRLLTSQGPGARGGAMDYVVGGRMMGGFGVVAYPAAYGNSGIMTFIVNHDGEVYQRDLGSDTEKTASRMQSFDPGVGWWRVDPVLAASP